MKKKAKKEHLNSECTVEEEKQLAVGSELLFFGCHWKFLP